MERHIGIIRKVLFWFQQPDEWAKQECERRKIPLDGEESYVKALVNYYYPPQFVEIKGELYEVLQHIEGDAYDSFSIIFWMNPDEGIFINQFDNGGSCFKEMIESPNKEYITKIDGTSFF